MRQMDASQCRSLGGMRRGRAKRLNCCVAGQPFFATVVACSCSEATRGESAFQWSASHFHPSPKAKGWRTNMKVLIASCFAVALALFGCSSSDMPTGPAGGPVAGAQDTHCNGVQPQVVDLSSCNLPADAGAPDYGPTNYNAEADDDDCKYHVFFTQTPVYENTNVQYTLTAVYLTDGGPATGANTIMEVYLNDTHPAPNSGPTTMENPPGVYTIGPILF